MNEEGKNEMASPCVQEPAIRLMGEQLAELGKTLATIAVQKNEIEHLVKEQIEHRTWLRTHETRIQALEKVDFIDHEDRLKVIENKPAQSASKIYWLVVAGVLSCVTGIISGAMLLAFKG
jgi:hypothetical protein